MDISPGQYNYFNEQFKESPTACDEKEFITQRIRFDQLHDKIRYKFFGLGLYLTLVYDNMIFSL